VSTNKDGFSTPRDMVREVLTNERVAWIRSCMQFKTDADTFRYDLSRVLTRYEIEKERANRSTKKSRRTSLMKLHDGASRFLLALNKLPLDVSDNIESSLDVITHDERWEGWEFFSDDPMPDDDDSLKVSQIAVRKIIAACQSELEFLDEIKGQPKGSANPALDHLIVELSCIFEHTTGLVPDSYCYRDETSEDEYNGSFYQMVKVILDEFAPKDYGTPGALGIRIVRRLRPLRTNNT
jgi:hypothetical protein